MFKQIFNYFFPTPVSTIVSGFTKNLDKIQKRQEQLASKAYKKVLKFEMKMKKANAESEAAHVASFNLQQLLSRPIKEANSGKQETETAADKEGLHQSQEETKTTE